MHPETIIPLFPLGVVLLPETLLPLHIFEERYKLMIRECLDQDKEFGIVYFDGNRIEDAGCTARILEVVRRYDDGRMDIITRGIKRFIIHEIYDREPYLQSRIGYFEDEIELEPKGLEPLAKRGMDLLRRLNSITGRTEDYRYLKSLDVSLLSFFISNSEGFTHEEKQKFLEMTSTSERLKKCVDSLEKIVERAKIAQEIQKIIGGNGKIRSDFKRQARLEIKEDTQ
jgi:Lon protease-like protein